MRVALFTETFLPKIDGVVTRVVRTLDQLSALGHEVIVFAPEYRHAENVLSYQGFPVIRLKSIPFKPWYPELRLGMPSTKIYSGIKRFAPDVVHTVNPFVIGAWGTVAARQFDLPLIASFHTDLRQYAERLKVHFLIPPGEVLVRNVHNTAQLNLTTSGPMVKTAQALGIKRIRIWPKAVDSAQFHPSNKSSRMREFLSQGNPDKPLMLCVGRLSHEKRVSWLLDPVRRIKGVRLAIVGGGPAEQELRQLFAGTDTFFAGYLQGRDLQEAYASADVFAFPSDTETLGFVAMESMASGVPVVGANAGGIPDVIRDGWNGLMFEPGNAQEFAEKLEWIVRDTGLRERLGRQARSDMETCCWTESTQRLLDYYTTAIRAHRRWTQAEAVA